MKIEMKDLYKRIEKETDSILEGRGSIDEKMEKICGVLFEKVEHYNWVGFYMANEKRELLLGPYRGEPTEHTKIKFGEGICGQAAEKRDVFIVQDVSKESNYLSCSPDVKSEIVIPIIKNSVVKGELDIDSHSISPFDDEDRVLLEAICRKLAEYC